MAESFKEFFCDRSFVPNAVEHSWEIAINVRQVSVAVLRIGHSGSDFCVFISNKALQATLIRTAGASFRFSLNYSYHFWLPALYNTQWEIAANIFRRQRQRGLQGTVQIWWVENEEIDCTIFVRKTCGNLSLAR